MPFILKKKNIQNFKLCVLKFCLVIIYLIGCSTLSYNQEEEVQPFIENIDSLKQTLKSDLSSEEEIRTLSYIGYNYWWKEDFENAIKYAKEAVILAKTESNDSLLIQPLNLLSSSYSYILDYDNFLKYNYELIQIAQHFRTPHAYMEALNDRGVYYLESQHKDSCLYYLKRLSLVSKKLPHNDFQAITLLNLGLLNFGLKLEEKANDYYIQSFEAAKEYGDYYTNFFVSAELYAYYKKNNLPDSAAFFLKEIEKAKEIYDLPSIHFKYLLILFRGEFLDGKTEKCEELLEKMNELNISSSQFFEYSQLELCKIKIEVEKGLFNEALQRINRNEKETEHFYDTVKLIEITEIKAKCFSGLGNFEEAFKTSLDLKHQTDSINEPLNEARMLALKMEHGIDRELIELRESNTRTNLEVEKKNLQFLTAFLGVIVLLILLGIAYYRFSVKKNQTKNLKRIVEQSTQEIKLANSSLKQKVDVLTAFNHITSHDLKQPIRNISSFTSLLLTKKHENVDAECERYLGFIDRACFQLNDLLNSLEYYNSIESELNKEVKFSKTSLVEIIDQSVDLVTISPEDEIKILPSIGTVKIITASSFVAIIIKNLIENGLKYNDRQSGLIEIGFSSSKTEHIIAISDNGIGIKPEYHEKIFLMFERLHSKSDYEGTGLGLAICCRLANALHGKITVESELGKGSTFKLHLPVR